MEPKTNQIRYSAKNKKNMNELIGDKRFFIPDNLSNDRHPETMEKVFCVRINGKATYIPTGKDTPVPYEAFCVLKDIGAIASGEIYARDNEFDPL